MKNKIFKVSILGSILFFGMVVNAATRGFKDEKELESSYSVPTLKYFSQNEKIIRQMYKATYKNSKTLDDIDIRTLSAPLTEKNFKSKIELQQKYMQILEDYCKQLPDSPSKVVIESTLLHYKNLGVDGFLGDEHHEHALLVLRILAAAHGGSLTNEEMDLFEPVPGSKLIFAMYQKVPLNAPSFLKDKHGEDVDALFLNQDRYAWQSSNAAIKFYAYQSKTLGKEHYEGWSYCLPINVVNLFEEHFNQAFGEKSYWPMLGAGKIGLSTLVKAILDDVHILPLPLPSSSIKLKAHGIALSQIALTFHDYLHSLQDKRISIVKEWCYRTASDSFYIKKDGRHYQEVVVDSIKEGKKRYDSIMDMYKDIFKEATDYFIDNGDTKQYNQKIIPVYLIFHEVYAFDNSWLGDDTYSNKQALLTDAIKKSKLHFKDMFLKINPYEEMLNNATDRQEVEANIINDNVQKGFLSDQDVLFDECSVKQNTMYTIVSIVLKDGQEYVYRYPVKANIERDLGDFLPLLKISGFDQGIDNTRSLYDQRDKIVQNIDALFDNFLKVTLPQEKAVPTNS